ncbi:MAG: hypothetical protein GXO02_02305 [Epsilonproteobacteria bacterium]|nr:hypothetical protein [Campylobacterota bacterium]
MKKILFVSILSAIFISSLFSKDKILKVSNCGVVRVAFAQEVMRDFANLFKIKILTNRIGGDLKVIEDILKNRVDIAMGCRPLFPQESKKLSAVHIGWGALAFIVNKNNKLTNISLEDVKKILLGKITNYKEIGGEDKPIHLYLRESKKSGVGASLRVILFKDKNKELTKNATFLKSSGYIREAIKKDPLGFGVDDVMSSKRTKGIKILALNGVYPTKKSIQDGKYLAFRPYYLYYKHPLKKEAKLFIEYILSKRGQKVISNSGTASLDEDSGMGIMLDELAQDENIESDNEIIEDKNLDFKGKKLIVYNCGVIRVAFAKAINKAFANRYNVKIFTNKKGGDISVINALINNKANISLGCRALFKDKKEKDLWSVQVGWGALAFIVNSKNKLSNISVEDIKKILLGKITNYKELGGEDKPIHLYLRESKKSGVGSSIREILFGDFNKELTKNATFLKSSGYIREAIKKDPLGFGVDDVVSSKGVKGIKILKVDGIFPTKENILDHSYPLRRPFYLYLKDKPKGVVKVYVDFLLSDEGQEIISKSGTANLEEARGKGDDLNIIFQRLKLRLKER